MRYILLCKGEENVSGFEIYTKKEKFAWDIAYMDISATFVLLTTIFAAFFSVFTMPYGFSCVCILQIIAIPLAVLVVWGRSYKVFRWAFVLLAGVVSFFYLKINLYNGVLACVNSAIQLINQCYGINLSPLQVWIPTTGAVVVEAGNEKISFLWILCVLEFLFGILILNVLKCGRGRFCAIFISLLPILLGIFCGKLPDVTSGCFLILAIFLFLTASYQREKGIPVRALVNVAIILCFIWLAARPIESSIYSYKTGHLKEYKDIKNKLIEARQLDVADWILESFDNVKHTVEEILPELKMGVNWNQNFQNLGKLNRTGKVLDEVILSSKPTDDVYWPLFEGYVYTGIEWAPKGSTEGIYDQLTKVKEIYPMKEYYDVDGIEKLLRDYFFSNHFKYTTNPKKIPEDMDFVEGFMFETKEGYCVYFATAATVFYQISGVEARYVEGYMIAPKYFEMQSDGTYKAVVTDYMAHAWCETYDADSGRWKVREHTLASGLPTYHQATTPTLTPTTTPTTTPTQMPTMTPTQGAVDDPTQMPTHIPGQEYPTTSPVEGDGNSNLLPGDGGAEKNAMFLIVWQVVKTVVIFISCIILGILILLFAILLQRRLRIKRKELRYKNKHAKKAILALYRAIQDLCYFAGIKDRQMWRQEHILQIAEAFPQLSATEWEWMYDCVQRTMFSNDVISTAEKKQMYHLYQQLRTGILKSLSTRRKLWFLYGRAL